MPHVFRVQRASAVHFARSLDNRPAIGKDRELERFALFFQLELEQELVEGDGAAGAEHASQLVEVELSRGAMADLNSVAATQGRRLRAVGAVEPLERPLGAA